jgi:hypothetical protein
LLPLIQAFNNNVQVTNLNLEQSDLSSEQLNVILGSLKSAVRLTLVTMAISVQSEHVPVLQQFLQDPGSLQALRLEQHGLSPQDCTTLQNVGGPCRLELA